MGFQETDSLDVRVRDALTVWKRLDEIDVKILEGLSLLGPRNIALIARHLQLPATSVRFRVQRMLSQSILFLHVNPYHTNMGLKKAIVFVEAAPGYENELLDCLRINDFWIFLCRTYGPYEGCGGIWTIPKENVRDFHSYLQSLRDTGIARDVEVIWSTCFEGIPVRTRWYSNENGSWTFNWDEWVKEMETIEGKLPYTLVEPEDWTIKVDYEDLLIIKELEKYGQVSLPYISKTLEIPLPRVKYHFHEHVLKHDLVESYHVEIYRFPFPFCETLFFKFEFDDYFKMTKFALSILDKPFATFLGKVLGENALIGLIYLPKWEFRKFVSALSTLIRTGLLKSYHYVIEDMYQTWRESIPYQHFKDGKWDYDNKKHLEELKKYIEKKGLPKLPYEPFWTVHFPVPSS